MSSINHTGSIPGTNSSTGSSYGNNLSLLAREAQATIPKNIVEERSKIYGRQVKLLKASKDRAVRSEECQNRLDQPSKEIDKKNTSPLNENRIVCETTFTNLPQDMKVKICTFLSTSSLKAMMSMSQEMHEVIGSDRIFQNRILYDFALEMVTLMEETFFQSKVSQDIQDLAVSLAKTGDMVGSETLFNYLREKVLLIEDTCEQSRILQNIALNCSEVGDEAAAMKTILLIKDPYLKLNAIQNITISIAMNLVKSGNIAKAKKMISLIRESNPENSNTVKVKEGASLDQNIHLKVQILLQNLAVHLAKSGDVLGSKEIFDLSKEMILLMEDDHSKSQAIYNITVKLAEIGDITRVKEMLSLMGPAFQQSSTLCNVAVHLAKNGDIAGSKGIFNLSKEKALLIKNDVWRSQALHDIAVNLAQNGDIEEAEGVTLLIKDSGLKLKTSSSIITSTAMNLAQNNDMIGSKKFFNLSKEKALLIENSAVKFQALHDIAVNLAKSGDRAGAKETALLAKERALLMKDNYLKSETLQDTARILAENGDIVEAEETALLAEEVALLVEDGLWKSKALHDIARILAENGNIAGAKEVTFRIKKDSIKSQSLQNIARILAENGDVAGTKEVMSMIEDDSVKSCALKDIAIALAKNGNIAEAKKNIANMKKMGYFLDAVKSILELIRIINPEKQPDSKAIFYS